MHETSPIYAFLRHIQLLDDESCSFCATLLCDVYAKSEFISLLSHFFRVRYERCARLKRWSICMLGYVCSLCSITNCSKDLLRAWNVICYTTQRANIQMIQRFNLAHRSYLTRKKWERREINSDFAYTSQSNVAQKLHDSSNNY